jgi:BirA family biotin operon repressor/biotin-[acetyl-CoA-carboxylase] ligase
MQLHRFDSLPSTNDHLKEMAEDGASEWNCVIARQQTSGRGRNGKDWFSPPGNLYISVLLKPRMEPGALQRIPLIASLALIRAVDSNENRVTLKWPNDVLLDGRKLAGILPEARTSGNVIQYVVLGFGVNILKPDLPPSDGMVGKAAWLHEISTEWDTEKLESALLHELQKMQDAFNGNNWNKIREEWSSHVEWGKDYLYSGGESCIKGRTVSISDDGSLMMQTDDGMVTVNSGELLDAPAMGQNRS